MKLLICGGRDYGRKWNYEEQRWRIDRGTVRRAFRLLQRICQTVQSSRITIVHGKAAGADSIAEGFVRYCRRNKLFISQELTEIAYPADWKTHGKKAGPIRNQQMLTTEQPDVIIVFPGGKGTEHMKTIGRLAGIPIYEVKK